MSKTYFISDTHFNHVNIIKYCNRPFENVEEMKDYIIKQWNSVVKADDIVWFLGDLALGNRETCREIVSKLNGRKRMVKGNHDNWTDDFYRSIGIEYVSKYPVILKGKIVLCHTPPEKVEGNYFYIFGHVHDKITQIEIDNPNQCKCVCVERTDYKPIKVPEYDNC